MISREGKAKRKLTFRMAFMACLHENKLDIPIVATMPAMKQSAGKSSASWTQKTAF